MEHSHNTGNNPKLHTKGAAGSTSDSRNSQPAGGMNISSMEQFISGAHMGFTGSSEESVQKIADVYRNICGQLSQNSNKAISVMTISGAEASLNVSSILLYTTGRTGETIVVPILVTDSLVKGMSQTKKSLLADGHGGSVEVQYSPILTVNDYASARYVQNIKRVLETRLARTNIVLAGWTYVPKDMDVESNMGQIQTVLKTALSMINPHTDGYVPLRGEFLQTKDSPLLIATRGRDESATDALGRPVRADQVIEMVRTDNFAESFDANNVNSAPRCTVYTALSFAYVNDRQTSFRFSNEQQQFKSIFRPIIKITGVRSAVSNSLGMTALGIVASLRLSEDRKWIASLIDTQNTLQSPVPMTAFIPSVDAAKAGKLIEPDKGKVDYDYLISVLSELITGDTGPLIKMDVEIGGPEASVAMMFKALIEDPASESAKRASGELNSLTGGLYGKYFEQAGMPAVGKIEKMPVPVGSYFDTKGIARDIRGANDLLALMNASKGREAPETVVAKWNSLMDDQAGDADLRFTKLCEYIGERFSANVDNKAISIVFNGQWLKVLVKSVLDSIEVRSSTDFSSATRQAFQQETYNDFALQATGNFFDSQGGRDKMTGFSGNHVGNWGI